jgi:hypothetical protein
MPTTSFTKSDRGVSRERSRHPCRSLRILYGELIGGETISFRERKDFTWESYRNMLRKDCARAGLVDRLDAMQPSS